MIESRRLLVILGCGLLVLSACGRGDFGSQSVSQSAVATTDPVADPALVTLYDTITGTAQQRSAGAYDSYRSLQDWMTKCMSAAGFDYPRAPWIDEWQYYVSNGGVDDTNWLAPLNDPVITREAQGLAPAQRQEGAAEVASPDPQQTAGVGTPGYSDAINACQSQAGTSYVDAGQPDAQDYEPILSEFRSMTADIDGQLSQYAAPYAACLKAAGYDATNRPELLDLIRTQLPDLSDIPDPGEQGDDAWQATLSYESGALAADTNCRADAYTAALDLLNPAIKDFTDTHSDQLARINTLWQSLVIVANQYPGSPGFGPSGLEDGD